MGWWPGDARHGQPAFYAYAYPAPEGFATATLAPPAAHWDEALGEYILDWEDAGSSPDPHNERAHVRALGLPTHVHRLRLGRRPGRECRGAAPTRQVRRDPTRSRGGRTCCTGPWRRSAERRRRPAITKGTFHRLPPIRMTGGMYHRGSSGTSTGPGARRSAAHRQARLGATRRDHSGRAVDADHSNTIARTDLAVRRVAAGDLEHASYRAIQVKRPDPLEKIGLQLYLARFFLVHAAENRRELVDASLHGKQLTGGRARSQSAGKRAGGHAPIECRGRSRARPRARRCGRRRDHGFRAVGTLSCTEL